MKPKHTPGPWRVSNRYFVESEADPDDPNAIGTVAACESVLRYLVDYQGRVSKLDAAIDGVMAAIRKATGV